MIARLARPEGSEGAVDTMRVVPDKSVVKNHPKDSRIQRRRASQARLSFADGQGRSPGDLTASGTQSKVENHSSLEHTEPRGIEFHVAAIISLPNNRRRALRRAARFNPLPMQQPCVLLVAGT